MSYCVGCSNALKPTKLAHQLARSLNGHLARLLFGLILPVFSCLAVTVTNQMVTKAINTSGCSVPTASTTFLTTDQTVYLWFNITGANAGDVPSATWYSPNGAVYTSSSWNPVASAGSWCFWLPMAIAGNPPASTPGSWSVRVSWNGSAVFTLSFTIAAPSAGLSINPGGILNAASYAVGTSVAPGSIVAVYGSFPLNSPSMTPGAPWPTSLGGLSMQFAGGTRAPLYYVSSGQANLLLPWELANQSQTSLTATMNGQSSAAQTLSLSTFSPGIFAMNGQGTGQGAIVDALSGRLLDSSNPATVGSTYVSIYCTGLGPVTNQPASGAASPSGPLAATPTTPTVTIGGAKAQVLFSGLAPGWVGEYQVNAQVPSTSSTGSAVPVTISIGGVTSNTVTIAAQPAPITTTPGISSVSPSSASAGQVLTVALNGTNFVQGQTLASFGTGISVAGAAEGQQGSVTVATPTTATATLTIDPAAATGTRTVTVATGAQTGSLSNAFTVLAAPAPMAPLTVTSTSPANGAAGVALTPTIQINFNDPLDPSTVGPTTFVFANGSTNLPTTAGYDPTKNQVTLTFLAALRPQTTYTVTVAGPVRNQVGNQLGTPYTFSFTTIPVASVTGTVTTPAGLDPTKLSVVSFGGKIATPSAAGSFSASLNPLGTNLVAAMLPGKAFGLLAFTIGNLPATSTVPLSIETPASTNAWMPYNVIPVHTTRWQVTASITAANSPTSLVADFQTTAEALEFMSPYFLTGDPQRAHLIMTAIAANPATAQLAQALSQHWSEADPLNNPAVQSANQAAVQAVAQVLISQTSPQPASLYAVMRQDAPRQAVALSLVANSSSPSPQPPTVSLTPYCWNAPGHTESANGLQCLDLDYLSFPAGSVSVNQSDGSYIFTPQTCTSFPGLLGCAVGWLGRITPIPSSSDSGNPNSITKGGPDSFGPESPVGTYDSASCSANTTCYAIWVDGNSSLQYLDLKSDFLSAVSYVAQHLVGSPTLAAPGSTFTLPAQSQQEADYVVRFYSGGLADAGELNSVMNLSYANGGTLFGEALILNAMESTFNAIDALQVLPDGVISCTMEATARIVAQRTVTASNFSTAAGIEGEFVSALTDGLNQVASCYQQSILDNTLDILKNVFTWGSGLGTILDASSAISNLGQAAQRTAELEFAASAVETAVVGIKPGSAVVSNPVPKITSLSPASAAVGGSSATVTIKGNSFLQSTTVFANDVTRTYTYVDSGTLTFTLASSDLAQAKTFSVEVRNPTPGGGSSTSIFTVASGTGSNPQPLVTSLTPSATVVGSAITVLSILGSNFMSNSAVTFAGSPHAITTPFDAGQLTITLNASDLAKAGTFPVVVTNPGPGGGPSACTATTSSCNFTVLNPTPSQPAVTAVSAPQRVYVVGDQFELNYAVLAGPTSQTNYDLMITVLSLASGTTYYYYDNSSDTNEWLHTTPRGAVQNYIPQSGNNFHIPSDPSAFQITSDVPSGDYHVKAYFSPVNANQQIGTSAETDFSVATNTAAGGCFVATAAFGSPMAHQVQWLRAFRDRILLPGRAGRAFVNWYYGWSPRAAAWLHVHSVARKLTRVVLWIPVAFAWSSLRTSVACASLGFLLFFLSLLWSLRRGPAWWKVACLLMLVIGIASAQAAHDLSAWRGDFTAPRMDRLPGLSGPGKSFRLAAPGAGSGARPEVAASYGQLPLHFEPNVGQTDGRVRFLARGGGMTAFFTDAETVMVLGRTEQTVVRMKLEKAGKPRHVAGVEKLPGITNYFIGNDPAKWRTDVPHFARIQYEGVYPGIDLVWYGNQRQLEYDFVVAPGADAKQIEVAYEGVESVGVESNGDLILRTALGEVRQQKPRVYQEIGGKRVDVGARYALVAHNRVGFELAGYDRKRELRIDPVVLLYSTYLGGSGDDEAQAIAVDGTGSAYVTGSTTSTNFPTQSPSQGTFQGGSSDVFVTKLASAGNALLYSTYLGGSGFDGGNAIAVDGAGSAYVTGYAGSTNFPTQSPYQATFQGSQDAFVTKLAPAGNALAYSTYLGGSGYDQGHGIAVDGAGSAYVTGDTSSTDFPTQSPYQAKFQGNYDVFVTKLAPAGNALAYSTYLGGSGIDWGNGIAVDGAGSAYVTGYTSSTNYPTQSPYQATYQGGTADAFVTKLTPAGNALAYSTYLGGSGYDIGNGIAVDGAGSAYVTGSTTSTNFPTQSPCQGTYGGNSDAFVTKLAPAGNALAYSTYVGGSVADAGYAIAVDAAGSAYVTGSTTSTNFPTQSPYQGTFQGGISDVFVTKLASAGNALLYSTYLGGSGGDGGRGIAVDGAGSAYLTGFTTSTDFPTQSPHQGAYQGGTYDAFVTKIVSQFATSQIATITTVAGNGSPNPSIPNGSSAISAGIPNPFDLDVDGQNNLYFINGGYLIDRVDTTTVYRVSPAGTVSPAFTLAPQIPTTYAAQAVGIPTTGDAAYVAVASILGNSVVRLDSKGQTKLGSNWTFNFPLLQSGGVGIRTMNGLTYIADTLNNRIIKIESDNSAVIIGGTGASGYSGDGGPAYQAKFNSPSAVAIDASGSVFVADSGNQCVRKISNALVVSTLAGTCTQAGFSGDTGQATAAKLSGPTGLAVGPDGTVYISDTGNNRIRRVNPNGTIETIAGIGQATFSNGVPSCFDDPFSQACFFGDGGDATQAILNGPRGIALDSKGRVYIADTKNNRIRMLSFAPKPGATPLIADKGIISAGAFGAFTSVAPGSWIEIYGTNFAADSRLWSGADFNGVNAPTSLDGTKVTVGGQSAFIDYISPTQVNAQVPSNVGTGSQPVILTTTAGGSSTASPITVNQQQPGLLAPSSFIIGGKQYVVALFSDGVTYVLPPGAITGIPSRRAQPGDNITLYGIGFGSVTPNTPAGQIVQQTNTLAATLHILFGQTEAAIQYDGLAPNAIGLYQFNVVVPNVAANDTVPVTFTLGGVAGMQTLNIAIQ